MMELKDVAKTLKIRAKIFVCSYRTAWEKWMHPAIADSFTFEEVMIYIKEK